MAGVVLTGGVRSARARSSTDTRRRSGVRVPSPTATRNRLLTIMLAFGLGFGGVAAKLVSLQTVSADGLTQAGLDQRQRLRTLEAVRGRILDRNGAQLALSVPAPTIVADPSKMTDPVGAAAQLAPIVGVSASILEDRFTQKGSSFAYVARQVDQSVADRVKSLALPGILFQTEPRRFHPSGELAGPVLGTVGIDENMPDGKTGVEYFLDSTLSGHAGSEREEVDQFGRRIPETLQKVKEATPGKDVLLTLDSAIQFETEQALLEEAKRVQAEGGMAIIMDVATGDLLSVATVKVDSNGVLRAAGPAEKNSPFTDVYEPGSTNKVITMSAAIDAGIVSPGTSLDVPLRITRAGFTQQDEHRGKGGPLTVTEILRDSSNVGTIMVAEQLGRTRLDAAMRAFGFGSTSSVGFPGEAAGVLLDPAEYSDTSMLTIPMGYGVAVTPIQMLDVYATIARGGVAAQPRLVYGTSDGHGVERAPVPTDGKQVVSRSTAQSITDMLEAVVASGTGKKAQIPGYSVAGKTGTAKKAPYTQGDIMASFAGFAPASQPALAAIVVFDRPTKEYYGGDVAAPAFQRMMSYALDVRQVGADLPLGQSK